MTLGRQEYTEADMLRMQRDAEDRVREMQNRARQTVEQDNLNAPPQNRNWSSGQGSRRQNRRHQSAQSGAPPPQQRERQQNDRRQQPEPPKEAPPPEKPVEKEKTTIIEDVMGALGLDEDYLLIIGLLLILINQRADTTLILALAYLLI